MTRVLSVAIRASLGLALFVGACSDPGDPPAADATPPDAAVDGDGGAEIDAIPIDAPPTSIEGGWQLTWTCIDNCPPLPAPAATHSDRLQVTGGLLHYYGSTCGDCVADHVGTSAGLCVDVPALTIGLDVQRPYQACATGPTAMELTIEARRVGGNDIYAVWRATGRRL